VHFNIIFFFVVRCGALIYYVILLLITLFYSYIAFFIQLEQQILDFSHGLRAVGVAPDEKVALFADNSCRWLVADQGIMATGAINVVRGTRSSDEELFEIYNHSERIFHFKD